MKKINTYEKAEVLKDIPKLPKGGYVLKILKAEEKIYKTKDGGEFSKLEINFDISSGDYKNYYSNEYKNQTGEDKKWKGVLRLTVPSGDGSEKDEYTVRIFKTTISAIEESNSNYHWDWDEKTLKDKTVGGLFRSREWEFNGRRGMTTECFRFMPAEDIKNNKFKIPEDKLLAKPELNDLFSEVQLDDLPF